MSKKFIVTTDNDGNETERKPMTSHPIESYLDYSVSEMLDLYYQSTAELYSKARKVTLLEGYLISLLNGKALNDDELQLSIEAGNNIIEAINEVQR